MSRDRQEITLVIDGREVEATEGTMLVDAAKQGDVEIPVFCYEPKLGPPVGACRMCLVEIEGIPKLQTACSTPVRDGMVVYTQTDQVKQAQSAVVEFLLVNHPLDCPVCDKGGECPLQDITLGWGPGRTRFTDPKRHFEKPVPLSPLVAIDRERCILCYRCVRFSQEVAEDEQLQLLERGPKSYVGTFDERPYIAPFHGNVTELCPVGALTNYTYRFRARPWDIEQAGSVCTLCPSQCNVRFTVRDEKVKRVLARDNPEVDDGWLCDKGRYGFEMLGAEERITAPMVRTGGNLAPVSWAEAVERAAAGLRAAGGKTAALVGDASNEEGYLVQRIVRGALGSADIDSRLQPGASRDALLALSRPELTAKMLDIDEAEAILVLGADPLHGAPILDLRIRKAMRRHGAVLAVAGERPTTLDGGAAETYLYAPGQAAAAIEQIHGGSAHGAGVADVLRGKKTVIVWGERLAADPAALRNLLELATSLEATLLEVPDAANARGLREVGCIPDAGPGLGEAPAGRSAPAIRDALADGESAALILFGSNPLRDAADSAGWKEALQASDFTVAFSMFEDESTKTADVVLPLQSHAEKEGTVTHPDGRLQRVRPSADPPGDVRPVWQVLAELSSALGHETGIASAPDALAAVADDVSFYAGITHEEIGGRGVRWQERSSANELPAPAGEAPSLVPGSAGAAKRSGPSPTDTDSTLRLGTYRDLWAGPITELNPALRFLQPAQRVEMALEDAERLGLAAGDEVEVSVNGASVQAAVALHQRMKPGSVFMVEGTAEANANALRNGGGETVEIRKVELADVAPAAAGEAE